MSAESPPLRYAARVLAAGACTLLALLPATGAPAQETGERRNPVQAVAEALDESRVYVDPAYESAFPVEEQERVAGAVDASGLDLHVVAVPLAEGDAWGGDAATLASVLHDRRGGGEGHYLVYDGLGGFHGADFASGGSGPAHYGALAASYGTEFDGSMLEQVDLAVETALSDDPRAAYDEALRAYEEAHPAPEDTGADQDATEPQDAVVVSDGDAEPGLPVWLWAVPVLLLALVPTVLLWRRRAAGTAGRRAVPVAQHAAFDNADRAQLDSLVEQGEHDLIEVGERLSRLDTESTAGQGAHQGLRHALDARSAAANVHDRMAEEGATLPDAVGVLVLLDMAEDEIDAVSRGLRAVVRRRHCYANPLHGTRTKVTPWREFGGTRTIRVPLCDECARAVRDRVRPVVLPAEHEGETVPYYEVPAEDSVWAATGYGTLTDDLVQRIQRGAHRRSRS
ncbi:MULTISPECIES: hypothetical protein [Nocardiopsis]|uniref:Uncharacterized protein n=1 Tax=Nocardiopsis sinuspersici TaxID=501010 RepID=A0A1V3C1W9_9ACTN|nr:MULTISPECIES: hypothetical protein [Nocardiopsis]OOC54459.1 hypothetical protein NOSIN_12115 [Nocardiopsis sinuspersici]